jgi:hypothetical protein
MSPEVVRPSKEQALIERLKDALRSTLPAVEEMIQQAAPRQKDHWHKILVEASTVAEMPSAETRVDRPLTDEQFYDAYIIHFEDADVPIEVFCGYGSGDAARKAFEQHLSQWNCQLFRMVDDGKRPHKRVWTGPGHLEETGYIDPSSVKAAERCRHNMNPATCDTCWAISGNGGAST